jgi:hypothetical protein
MTKTEIIAGVESCSMSDARRLLAAVSFEDLGDGVFFYRRGKKQRRFFRLLADGLLVVDPTGYPLAGHAEVMDLLLGEFHLHGFSPTLRARVKEILMRPAIDDGNALRKPDPIA